MNKGDLIKVMADKADFTEKDAMIAYNAFIETITEALKKGEKVSLVGFGTFEVKEIAAKTGKNPKTGETVEIASCKKPVMKFGKSYKDLINN